ncbi:hypothetical protein ACHAXM_006387 [Skeletonema potamos]
MMMPSSSSAYFHLFSCLTIILASQNNYVCTGFTTPPAIISVVSRRHHQRTINSKKAASLYSSNNKDSYSSDNTDEDEEQRPSSDLRALLPKPASRPLKMDKFGRRIYRMEDDTTVRHTKGTSVATGGDDDTGTTNEKIIAGDRALSSLLADSKQIAGDKSRKSTFENISTSSDLTALLPTAKMRFMKLDKFGRRVQRMEDDGTVSYSRGSTTSSANVDVVAGDGAERSDEDTGSNDILFTISDSELPLQQGTTTSSNNKKDGNSIPTTGPSLSKLISPTQPPTPDLVKDASTSSGIYGTDLKSLLPTTKMRFMKLDKFGRRVQRMEDDGTVSYSRGNVDATTGGDDGGGGGAYGDGFAGEDGPSAATTTAAAALESSESMVDLGTRQTSGSYVNQSGSSVNLKDLALTSKRPIFTKLDFKGGSVEDDRRTKSLSPSSSFTGGEGGVVPSSGLKGLALSSKRPIFTKLDFKGGSVEDNRRMKTKAPSTTTEASTPQGNLKDLLPKRPTFTKLDFKGGSVEDERRMKKQSSSSSTAALLPSSSSGSLKTLLPERKFMWRNEEMMRKRSTTNDFIGSVGGDFIARTTTTSNTSRDSVREMKQKAMRDEVIAAASTSSSSLEDATTTTTSEGDGNDGGEGGGGSYSNLTDLLPQKKFVFRDTTM